MHPRHSSIDDIRRLQKWQTFQPKACSFGFAVSKLPRLDNLIGLAPATRHQADGILNSDLRDVGVGEQHEQVYRLYLLCLLILPPSSAADGETSARRKGNHHVPLIGIWPQSVPSVTYDVELTPVSSRENIEGPSIMAPLTKGASDRAGKLTRDQDFQVSSLSASFSWLLCSSVLVCRPVPHRLSYPAPSGGSSCCQPLVSQPLPINCGDEGIQSLQGVTSHVRGIQSEGDFVDVAANVLCADVVPSAVNAALQERPYRLNRVRMNPAALILASAVVHRRMVVEQPIHALIAAGLICHDLRAYFDMLKNRALQRLFISVLNREGNSLASPLAKPQNSSLTDCATSHAELVAFEKNPSDLLEGFFIVRKRYFFLSHRRSDRCW